ncbi:hypothetical protein PHLCEN_2v4 [Hermanssonia centrifuga]|uniref:Protein kinase domain-containing protein n=1 Tax=Hermanssonia centrifuga TaxID=98765 RepID=A0A2R6S762_9APHY|nr:hypothetical protein PHLCEN_2v4 [Hermanssonia centrifuga]
MTRISGREIKDTLIDAKGADAGELTMQFDVSFGPTAQFTLTEDLCRDYPTANRLRNVIRQSEHIRDLDVVRNGSHAASGTRTMTLWELWRAAQSNIRMRYAKFLKAKVDGWYEYITDPEHDMRHYQETIVKDGVLRYNAAEDLLIQISLLVDYFLDTHEAKPVNSEVASELVYGIAQAVLLLEEVVDEPIISLMYSQLRRRDKDFMDRRTCLCNLRCKLLIHREGHPRQEVLESVDHWKPADLLRYAWDERRQEPNQRPFTDALLFLRGPEVQIVFDCIKFIMMADAKKPETGLTADRLSFFRRILTHLAQHAERLPAFLFLSNVHKELSTMFSGGFGIIYEGHHEGTKVAIKVPRVFAGQDKGKDRIMKQFYQEVIVWQSLRHEHILNILGVTYLSDLGAIAMVSPFMSHGSLGLERRNSEKVSTQSINTWIKQIAQGMAYLHDQQIVHGDLRADNVFLDENYSVHVADFGLSVYADGYSGNYHSSRSGNERWTAVEMLFPGEFPDVSQSGRPTKEADVYSFAFLCMELYTGKIPFSDEDKPARSVALHVLAGLRLNRPNGPDGRPMADALWALVQLCWAQDPKQRPQFRAVCEQLDGMFP